MRGHGHAAETPAHLPASAVVTDALVIARRNLLHIIRTPQLLVFSTIQPVMFVLLFRYVFGGSISVPGGSYVAYLLPGVFVQTVVFGSSSTAVGLAMDVRAGSVDRFRSLPLARAAVLFGRTLAATVRNGCVIELMFAGCYVVDGTIKRASKIRVSRGGIVVHDGEITSLRRVKDDVREVTEGFECGIVITNFENIDVGDTIEAYEIEKIRRTLDG